MATTERRVVSVVFCDVVDFTGMSEALDPEDVAGIQEAYFERAARVVAEHDGHVEKFIGDAVMATFGTLRTDDDDPVRAARAGLALVEAASAAEDELGLERGTLRVRVGVDTGNVVVTRDDDGWRVTGDTVNTAARLQAAAAPGEVLLGPETAFGAAHVLVVEPGATLTLKGKAAPLPTWRVVAPRPERVRGLGLHGLRAPLLGREAPLAELEAHLERAGVARADDAVLLVAPPGVGKTRLVAELAARAAAARHATWTVQLGVQPDRGYGALVPLLEAAVASLVGTGAEGGAPVADHLADALVARGFAPEHGAAHARRTAALLAREQLGEEPADLYTAWTTVLDAVEGPPPVWVVEDVHLAAPDLRAFLRHAVAHPRRGGRLVVLTGRPAGLAPEDLPPATTLHLPPLDDVATRALVEHLVGAGVVPDDFLTSVVAASGGNPLFVEELLRSWIQAGVLTRDDGPWAFQGGDVEVPSTVHAIYQGQLDALPGASRSVVERGSVPGVSFPLEALPTLGVQDPLATVDDLTRSGLLSGPHEDRVSDRAYTYRHVLLRDTAYGSMARRHRAELHVRFARWLRDRRDDADELVGAHLALAVETLPTTAAGLADGTTPATLAAEAADALEAAARDALVSSPQRAADLVARALDLPGLQAGADRLRRRLLLGEAERRSNRLEPAMTAFATAAEQALAREDADALLEAALGHESALFASRLPRTEHGARSVRLLRAAEAALPPEDRTRRSRVLAALGRALVFAGDAAGAAVCEQAVVLAEASGDPAAIAGALLAQRPAQAGPALLARRLEAGRRTLAAADATEDLELRLEAERLHLLDTLEHGDLAAADAAQERATDLVARLGRPLWFWYPPMWRAARALLAGDLARAEGLVEAFRDEGRRAHYADVAQVWAIQRMRWLLDAGRPEDALDVVEPFVARDPTRWSFASAVVLARLGDAAAARRHVAVHRDVGLGERVGDLSWSTTTTYLAEAAHRVGDVESARALAGLLAPWAGHVVVLGSGALVLGSASYPLGLALATAGDRDAAVRSLEEAVRQDEALGAVRLAAEARAALERVRAGDVPGAGA
ncbi:adenylate/guanylate cyclase domain-containing protein [Actinotalea solisilvae]|uniref:adenylate/guanylate cyclase domain-containing protein n=1 Tax=Actinotalea solisilvae TaxID=2072922 RepID=UPI0018F10A39|nr:adenylate/guanylate cyclase domain-containing protein [Actinotalea solisilvae]